MKLYQRPEFSLLGIILVVAVLWTATVWLETPVGSLSGVVIDQETGLPMPEARVVVFNEEKEVRLRTNALGRFSVADLPVARYTVKAVAPGYNPTQNEQWVDEGKATADVRLVLLPVPSYLQLYARQSVFAPGEKPQLTLRGRLKNPHVKCAVYRVQPWHYVHAYGRLFNGGDLAFVGRKPLAAWDYTPQHVRDDGTFRNPVDIPVTELGDYIVRVEGEKKAADQFRLTLTRIGLITKRSPYEILVFAVDLQTNRPLPGVQLAAFWNYPEYSSQFKKFTGVTDRQGLFRRNFPVEGSLLVAAKSGDSFASTYSYVSRDRNPYRMFLYTDRPIYRPHQTVYFKGLVRLETPFGYQVVRQRRLSVKVQDAKQEKVYSATLTTNDYGSFFGEFDTGDEPALGEYSLEVSLGRDLDFYHSFQVQEYRKPEYEVTVETKEPRYIQGQTVEATVTANYFFGAPVPFAKVRYTVYEEAYWYWDEVDEWADFYGYESGYGYDGDYYDEGGYGRVVAQGEATTNESGRANISVKSEAGEADRDMTYRIEVEVTDASRLTVTSEGSCAVTRAAYKIFLDTDAYIFTPREPATVHLRARTYEGKPVPRQRLEVRTERERWDPKEEKTASDLVETVSLTTDAQGCVDYTFTVPEAGYYRVTATGQDQYGNTTDTEYSLWFASSEYEEWEGNREEECQLVADKDVYKKGETARILLNTAATDAIALVTVEGPKLYTYWLQPLRGSVKVIEVPTRDEYVPNVYVGVAIIAHKKFYSRDVILRVSPQHKFLNVAIAADRERYHPGDEATYTVTVKDERGRPAQAELSLGLVDEAIYALVPDRTPNIQKFFYHPRYNSVDTGYSFPEEYVGGPEKDLGNVEVRKDFKDTAFWQAALKTDRTGRVRVTVKLPDNLTTWRATVRAHTPDTAVGEAVQRVLVSKDIIARLAAPRFFTQRDEVTISGVIHNYTPEAQNVRVRLDTAGVELLGEGNRLVKIPADGLQRFQWRVRAGDTRLATLTLRAAPTPGPSPNFGGGEPLQGDGMELKLPVRPHGMERVETRSGEVTQDAGRRTQDAGRRTGGEVATEVLTLPAEVVDSTVELRVNLTPSPGSAAFGALDYLVGYPYGCTEQTMSRFLPCVLVQRTVQVAGQGNVMVRADLPALVRAGLKRLYNFQHSDGGWGWWEYDSSNGYLTAYVVYGLTEAQAAGYAIEPGRIDRALRFLRGKLAVMQKEKLPDESTPRKEIQAKPERSRQLAEQVYVMYALSLHRSVPDAAFNFVYQEKVRDDLNDYSRALFAMAMHHHGRKKQAEKVLAELQAQGVQEQGRCYWKAPTDQWGWTDNDIETTAYALRAFLQIDPENPLCGRIANWLVLHRENGYYWESTKDTAAAVFALADYLRVRREIAPPNYTARVLVNGEEIGRLTMTPDDLVRPDEVFTVLRNKVRDGENEVQVVKEGEGDLFYSVSLRFYGLEEDMPARSGGLTVERRYYQLRLMEGADEGQEFIRQELAGEVRSGQQVEVALQIKADADYEYLIIEDPFPAGFEPVIDYQEGDGAGDVTPWYCRREAHDDRMAFFATRLNAGEHTLAYRLRAQIPGDFHALPARAYGMYAPRISGNSAETRVAVK